MDEENKNKNKRGISVMLEDLLRKRQKMNNINSNSNNTNRLSNTLKVDCLFVYYFRHVVDEHISLLTVGFRKKFKRLLVV
jgi:hypothetical protein